MVVADTDVIIAALRGNDLAKRLLVKYMYAGSLHFGSNRNGTFSWSN